MDHDYFSNPSSQEETEQEGDENEPSETKEMTEENGDQDADTGVSQSEADGDVATADHGDEKMEEGEEAGGKTATMATGKEDEDEILTLSPARTEDDDEDGQNEEDSEIKEINELDGMDVEEEGKTKEVSEDGPEKDDWTIQLADDQNDGSEDEEGEDGDCDAGSNDKELDENETLSGASGSKANSTKDDNDKDTVSTATAEEGPEGSEEMNLQKDGDANEEGEFDEDEEHEGNDSSFLSAENLNRIAEHAHYDSETDLEEKTDSPKKSKRGRKPKMKDFGAYVTEDEDLGLIIDPEWKEKKRKSLAGFTRGRPGNDSILDMDVLRVPFEYGWRREIVVRSQKDGQSNPKQMDTYYFPPTGSKLRSMVQIAEYLSKHESPLSTDNFSFARKCISEPPFEILRQANQGRGRAMMPMKRGRGRGRGRGRPWGRGFKAGRSPGRSPSSPRRASFTHVDPNFLVVHSTPKPDTPKRKPGRPPKISVEVSSLPPPEVVIEREEEDEDLDSPPIKFGETPTSIKRSHSDVDAESDLSASFSEPKKKKATARKSTTPRVAQFRPVTDFLGSEMAMRESPTADRIVLPTCPMPPSTSTCKTKICKRCKHFMSGLDMHPTCYRCRQPCLESRCENCEGSSDVEYSAYKEYINSKLHSKTLPPQPLGQLCTLQCPGLEGCPPTLQCAGCMCLFHEKCVNYKRSGPSLFLCLICAQDPSKKLTPTTNTNIIPSIANIVSQPSKYIISQQPITSLGAQPSMFCKTIFSVANPVSVKSVTTTLNQNSPTIGALKTILDQRKVPNAQNVTNLSSFNVMPAQAGANSHPGMRSLLLTTSTNVMPSLTTVPIQASSLSNSQPTTIINAPSSSLFPTSIVPSTPPLIPMTIRPPPPLTKPSQLSATQIPPPRLTAAPGVIAPVSQNSSIQPRTDAQIGVVAPKQPDIPLNAQLLTLPEAVTKRLKLSQPLALKINNIQIVVPPSCVINSSDGLKVLLPPSTFPLPSDPNAKLSVTVSNNTAGLEGVTKDATAVKPTETNESQASAKKNTPVVSSPSTRASKRRLAIDAAMCYIKKLYGGYDCMLLIFEYLQIKDLLRASIVCRTWNKIAMQPCLWKRLRLRGTLVGDWEAATRFFRKARVESLCLQGMYHKHDRNRTWHLMLANLHYLVGLHEIEFGHVPASVLHQVCEKLVNLEVFKAEFISEVNGEQSRNVACKVDLGKFVCLNHLRDLRLRGVGGLTLPAFSFNGGLAELSALKHLEKLSLTSLRSIPDNEFHFLRDMKQLKYLEVGNCNTWSSETYFVLGTLTNLQHLRLEYGGEMPDIGLGDALNNLPSLECLELVHFLIADSLHTSISALHKLVSLVVWPEGPEMPSVNTSTLSVVSKLNQLQSLEWGVIVTDKFSPESDSDQQSMWIPFRPTQAVTPADPATQHPINKLSLIQLTDSLAGSLPHTDIKVKKIKSQSKVNGWSNDS